MNDYTWLPFPSPTLGAGSDPRRERALAGFLAGPENRFAAAAARLAVGGVPFFADSPLSQNLSVKVKRASRHSARPAADGAKNGPFDWRLPPPKKADGSEPEVIDYMPAAGLPHFSPLVFYGPTGCGKTQLARGIYTELRKKSVQSDGAFWDAVDFYRDITAMIAENRADPFRQWLSACRVIALDNLDQIEEYPAAVTEFLRLLRSVEQNGALVIVTLSRHPDSIPSFPASLRARLLGGLLVPVSYPERPTRLLLLRRYAETFQITLSPEAEESMLESFPPSPGEMYSLFSRLYYEQQWDQSPPSPAMMKKNLETPRGANLLSLERIAKSVARAYSLKLSDLRGKTRRKSVVTARNLTLLIARDTLDVTLQELGRYFAGRDHSTILHGIRTIDEKMKTDSELRFQYDQITKKLGNLRGLN